jgi:hypothetical protein
MFPVVFPVKQRLAKIRNSCDAGYASVDRSGADAIHVKELVAGRLPGGCTENILVHREDM